MGGKLGRKLGGVDRREIITRIYSVRKKKQFFHINEVILTL